LDWKEAFGCISSKTGIHSPPNGMPFNGSKDDSGESDEKVSLVLKLDHASRQHQSHARTH
jgi:hypothetical protein